MENPRPFSHTAFIFKREGKRPNQGRWLECGVARAEKDGTLNVYLDRLPVGGFTGRVHLAKRGTTPGPPEPGHSAPAWPKETKNPKVEAGEGAIPRAASLS